MLTRLLGHNEPVARRVAEFIEVIAGYHKGNRLVGDIYEVTNATA